MTLFAIPFGFVIGVLPALIAALLDWFLARRGVSHRPGWCALTGSLVGMPMTLSNFSLKQ